MRCAIVGRGCREACGEPGRMRRIVDAASRSNPRIRSQRPSPRPGHCKRAAHRCSRAVSGAVRPAVICSTECARRSGRPARPWKSPSAHLSRLSGAMRRVVGRHGARCPAVECRVAPAGGLPPAFPETSQSNIPSSSAPADLAVVAYRAETSHDHRRKQSAAPTGRCGRQEHPVLWHDQPHGPAPLATGYPRRSPFRDPT